MTRRPNPSLWAALALPIALLAAPAPARAAGIPSPQAYRLTNNSGATVDHVFIGFVPTGAITEPEPGQSPLFLKSAPTFDGIKPDVGLFNYKKTADSPEEQALGLDFKGTGFGFLKGDNTAPGTAGGLKPGESITFRLNLNEAVADKLMLTLLDPPPSAGLAFGPDVAATPGPGPVTPPIAGGGTTQVPEPLSLVVWASLLGLGLARVRAQRRRLALLA